MKVLTKFAALTILFPVLAIAETDGTRNVLVFGDSITWGWLPAKPIVPTIRHAAVDRWPNIMAAELGDEYNVITEGLSGRTTNIDDPGAPGLLNGAEYLDSALFSHEPIDLVIIMLGTNDTKTYLDRTPLEIGLGMGELINIVQEGSGMGWYTYENSAPEVLVISPPPLAGEVDPLVAEIFDGAQDKIAALPSIYASIAEAANAQFFDAATVVEVEEVGVDGIHLLVEGNQDLGLAVAEKVQEIMK
ncbi:MAG: SGNH/GDSL hydrolase family protein [Granulosicoccus sp.]